MKTVPLLLAMDDAALAAEFRTIVRGGGVVDDVLFVLCLAGADALLLLLPAAGIIPSATIGVGHCFDNYFNGIDVGFMLVLGSDKKSI